jgi:hypothetical protein
MEGTRVPKLDDVQRAINKNDRREALLRSDLIMQSGKHFMDSAFWMQRANVMLMNRDDDEAMHCVTQAQGLKNYDPTEYESFLRKLAWYYVGHRDGTRARRILDEFEGWYTKPAELVWLHAMRGMSYFTEVEKTLASRGFKARQRIHAANEFATADQLWREMDPTEQARQEELRKTTRFQWFLTLVEIDTVTHQSKIQELFRQIMDTETDRGRRLKMYTIKPTLTLEWLFRRLSSSGTR